MSYNPSVVYSGPDGATRSVTNELTERFGYPARPYEFVTGWKDAGNVSGHNPDSNGITHGVDIFMTDAQNRWAADHLAARGRAGDPRVAYVIYAGQIASPSTGFYFAGSGWEHWDHPHLSVWDGYWGGYCSLPAIIYNDTSSWGIATLAGQNSGITPIMEEGFLMALPEADQVEVVKNVRKLVYGQQSQDKVVGALSTQVQQLSTQLEEVVGNARKAVYGIQDVKAGLAALPAKDIAAAIPDDLARQVIDALAERLGK